MAAVEGTSGTMKVHDSKFPWHHVVGFAASILLTIVALMMVLHHSFHTGPLLGVIVLLAVLQIFVQLFFFMHVTEHDGPAYHTLMFVIGLFMVVAIVGGSMWIMAFHAQVQ